MLPKNIFICPWPLRFRDLLSKQIRPECHDDCFYPRTLDDAFKGASYGSPIEVNGRKIGLPLRSVGNVTYLRNGWWYRIVRWMKR